MFQRKSWTTARLRSSIAAPAGVTPSQHSLHSTSQEESPMTQSLARSTPAFVDTSTRFVGRWRFPLGLALLLWAAWISNVDLRLLFSKQTFAALVDLLRRLFPPDLSLSFVKVTLRATYTTAATALIATAISSILALPLGILASG